MSAAAGRAASKIASTATTAAGKAAESGGKSDQVLAKGARRDPELYVRLHDIYYLYTAV